MGLYPHRYYSHTEIRSFRLKSDFKLKSLLGPSLLSPSDEVICFYYAIVISSLSLCIWLNVESKVNL